MYFKYKKNNVETLKDINFTIKKQKITGLFGLSGSGKSTLLDILMNLYEYKGDIFIGDLNFQNIDQNSIQNNCTLITQEPFFFSDSIINNLKLENDNLTLEEVEEACKKANIHEKIAELDDGYNTKIGEMGVEFSVGEKQRLAIARAILRNTQVYYMDEITANLDSLSEQLIKRTLVDLAKDKTIVLVAHKSTFADILDEIILLQDGQVVQYGNRKDMINHKYYKEMFNN